MTEIEEEHSEMIISQQRSSVNSLFFSLLVKQSGEDLTPDAFFYFCNRSEELG